MTEKKSWVEELDGKGHIKGNGNGNGNEQRRRKEKQGRRMSAGMAGEAAGGESPPALQVVVLVSHSSFISFTTLVLYVVDNERSEDSLPGRGRRRHN